MAKQQACLAECQLAALHERLRNRHASGDIEHVATWMSARRHLLTTGEKGPKSPTRRDKAATARARPSLETLLRRCAVQREPVKRRASPPTVGAGSAKVGMG